MAKKVNLPLGFSLKESDDHIVELWYKGERVGRFSATSVTSESLEKAAEQHLETLETLRRYKSPRQ